MKGANRQMKLMLIIFSKKSLWNNQENLTLQLRLLNAKGPLQLYLFSYEGKDIGRFSNQHQRTFDMYLCGFKLIHSMPLAFLYSLKTSENLLFSYFFQEYINMAVTWNRLTNKIGHSTDQIKCIWYYKHFRTLKFELNRTTI